MGKLFDIDSPLMNVLNKLADLIILNFLTFICCIPIITIGASMTALHHVLLKIVRNEEGYVVKSFFKSFKQNFWQATVIWLIMLAAFLVLLGDFYIFGHSGIEFPSWLRIVILGIVFLVMFAVMHVFPVLARFENTVLNTYKNSLFMGILTFPKTILMMVCWVATPLVIIFFPQIFPIGLMLGISGPAYISALLYNNTFKRFEPQPEEITADEDWVVEETETVETGEDENGWNQE